MIKALAPIVTVAVLLASSGPAAAQDSGRQIRQDRKERIQKFLQNHPEMKARIDEWKALTPEQRKEKIQQKRQELKSLAPDARRETVKSFLNDHPVLKHRIKKFMRRHLAMKVRLMAKFGIGGTGVTR